MAVVLAYSEGAAQVPAVLAAVADSGIATALVLSMAVPAGLSRQLQSCALELSNCRIEIIEVAHNAGSAGGYGLAIEAALELDPTPLALLLLDDDILISRPGLESMLGRLESLDSDAPFAVVGRRFAREYEPLSREQASRRIARGDFLGFDLIDRLRRRRTSRNVICSDEHLAWAPYGGTLLPVETARLLGRPREEFFLYGDDLEFTSRIVRMGGELVLVEDAGLVDIRESGLAHSTSTGFLRRLMVDTPPDRRDLWVRNEAWRLASALGLHPRLLLNVASLLLTLVGWTTAHPRQWRALVSVTQATIRGLVAGIQESRRQPVSS